MIRRRQQVRERSEQSLAGIRADSSSIGRAFGDRPAKTGVLEQGAFNRAGTHFIFVLASIFPYVRPISQQGSSPTCRIGSP